MRIQYNSPVILTFALISTIVLLLDQYLGFSLMTYFTVYPVFEPWDPIWYLRLFSHALGHGSWEHLVSNFAIILLIGPILEEKYGSRDMLFMILLTALLTGILQIIFFETALLGASGIVFMMILLGSFTNSQTGYIPLTFILVVILYLGREIFNSMGSDNVSQFAHIIGGVCGGIFGFVLNRTGRTEPTKKSPTKEFMNPLGGK
ncbi:MAG: rhomboid family intramembrane serine protease [Bacteroidota bacterium]